ncbi:cupin domain-containing protein, partial [Bacillus sp. 'calajunan']
AEGSDILRLTPPEVFQAAYGVSAEKLGKDLSQLKESVVIGPPNSNRLKGAKESGDSNIVVTLNGQITSCEIE